MRLVRRLLPGLLPVILGLSCSLGSVASAASLDVRPTLVRIGPTQPTVALTLESADPEEHSYQVRIFHWLQRGSEQVLEPTQDIIANPPIVRIVGGTRQIVRLGLRNRAFPAREGTYRLVLDELPTGEASRSGTLSVLLRLTLPVFVRDAGEAPAPALSGSASVEGGRLHAIIRNDGAVTERVTRARLSAAAGRAGDVADLKYILPGGETEFVFPPGATPAGGALSLALETERGAVTVPLALGATPRTQTASTGLPVLTANPPGGKGSDDGKARQP